MSSMSDDAPRHDGRPPNQHRDVHIIRNWLDHAEGSVLVEFGKTRVLVAASFIEGVPRWLKGKGTGWVTAEYEMLPRSTSTRSDRESRRGKVSGRTHEISRLIGRSLRSIIDTKALGVNTIILDCDVLQADGGTRAASITGAYVALVDAIENARSRGLISAKATPFTDSVAAVSVGIINGHPVLDLDYPEDSTAATDMNVVMTGAGGFVEVQGTAEGAPFDRAELDALLALASKGIGDLSRLQQEALDGFCPGTSAVAEQVDRVPASRVVLATRNAGKLREMQQIVAETPKLAEIEVVSVSSFPNVVDVVESAVTFVENASLKARAVAKATNLPAIADDSGLLVDVLGGCPGVFSARWSGMHGDDQANIDLLLAQVDDVPAERLAAHFTCCVVLAMPDGTERIRVGELYGMLTRNQRGSNGFGYGPIFELPDGRSLAQLTDKERNQISHRGHALRALRWDLAQLLRR